jgi:alkylation response protein AidB-like acyl-CoA dehydrogenase
MIGSGSAVFPATLPRATYDRIYAEGPDVILAGSAQPAGTAEEIEGGYRISGRWPFASGCQHADWIFGLATVTSGGMPVPGPVAGMPLARLFILPASRWQIEDTWRVAGLKGTGSNHVALTNADVPEANCFDLQTAQPCVPGPLYGAALALVPTMHAAVAIGIAEGALADLVSMANTGRRHQRAATPLRESPIFQYELGRIEADFRAAAAYFRLCTESHWRQRPRRSSSKLPSEGI